ncbi:unnamed protein product [Arctogadus glacialis]
MTASSLAGVHPPPVTINKWVSEPRTPVCPPLSQRQHRRHSFAGSQTARRPLHRTSKDATHGFLYESVVSPKNLTPFWVRFRRS